jgi:hypothetical protein
MVYGPPGYYMVSSYAKVGFLLFRVGHMAAFFRRSAGLKSCVEHCLGSGWTEMKKAAIGPGKVFYVPDPFGQHFERFRDLALHLLDR